MVSQRDNFKYFESNRASLVQKYSNKFVVINNGQVVGAYKTEKDAYDDASKIFKLGSFLIQQCVPEIDERVAVFHTRAIFN